jgi:hypothetical protein
MLHGSRLGVLIFMMKSRDGCPLHRSIARRSKRSIYGASRGGCLRFFSETYLVHSLSSASNIDIISVPSLSLSGSMS